MNRCEEYIELISAYLDGELSESDRISVEMHISECAECSAIVDVYKGMSLAVKHTLTPAPESLLRGVMAEIGGAKQHHRSSALKISSNIRFIQSKVIPAVACIAFIILLVPIVRNLSRSKELNDSSAGTSMSQESSLQTNESAEAGGGAMGGNTGGAYGGESAMDDNALEVSESLKESQSGTANAPQQEPAPLPSSASAGGNSGNVSDEIIAASPETDLAGSENDVIDGMDGAMPTMSPGAAPAGTAENSVFTEEAMDDEAFADADAGTSATGSADRSSESEDVNSQYFAVLVIRGELPDILTGFNQVLLDDFTRHIVIPPDLAFKLIDEEVYDMEITYGNATAVSALVIYIASGS